MSKQDIFNQAKNEYQNYLYTGNKHFKELALNYYNQYKALKGKKVIELLES